MKLKIAGVTVGCLVVLGVLAWLVWPSGGVEIKPATTDQSADNTEPGKSTVASQDNQPEQAVSDPCAPAPEVSGDEWGLEDSRRFSEVHPDDGTPPDDKIDWRREQLKAPIVTRRKRPKPGTPVWQVLPIPDEVPPEITALAEMQNRKGHWRPDGRIDPKPLQEDAIGPEEDSVFATAIAMLAALQSGYHHKEEGKEDGLRQVVRQAMFFARKIQNNDGNFAEKVVNEPVLHHAAALFALCECYRASGEWVLKPICEKGLDYLFDARNPDGGWGFKPLDERSNVLATGFALLAMRTASAAHLDLPKDCFADVAYWMWPLRRNGFTAWGPGVEDMPAGDESTGSRHVADTVFVLAMKWGGFETLGDWSVDAALERLRNQPTEWDGKTNSLMAWMLTSIALWEVDPDNALEWSTQAVAALEAGCEIEQRGTEEKPDLAARWESADWWSAKYGRVFTQAAATMTLFQCRSNVDPATASESGDLVMQPD